MSLSQPIAEDFGDINRRLRELREEAGILDDDPMTAASDALDAIADIYGMTRGSGEPDVQLRARILIKLTSRIKQ